MVDDGLDEVQRILDLKELKDTRDTPIICTTLDTLLLFSTKINDTCPSAVSCLIGPIVSDSAH